MIGPASGSDTLWTIAPIMVTAVLVFAAVFAIVMWHEERRSKRVALRRSRSPRR